MELSYFLSMVQYEVLKSFDFNSLMQDEMKVASDSPIQLAIEAAEIEIPVIFNSSVKEIKIENSDISDDKESSVKSNISFPFSTSIKDLKIEKSKMMLKKEVMDYKISQKKATTKKNTDKTITGHVIDVEVANPNSKRDDSYDAGLIGKIKLIIKPVVK